MSSFYMLTFKWHLNEEFQFNYIQQEMYKNNTLIVDRNQIKRSFVSLGPPCVTVNVIFFQNCKGNQTLIILASVKIKRGHVIG